MFFWFRQKKWPNQKIMLQWKFFFCFTWPFSSLSLVGPKSNFFLFYFSKKKKILQIKTSFLGKKKQNRSPKEGVLFFRIKIWFWSQNSGPYLHFFSKASVFFFFLFMLGVRGFYYFSGIQLDWKGLAWAAGSADNKPIRISFLRTLSPTHATFWY